MARKRYELISLHSKDIISNFFSQNEPALHIYEIGDLDDFFFPYTTWSALVTKETTAETETERGENQSETLIIHLICLIYQTPDVSVLLAFGRDESLGAEAIDMLRNSLPNAFYSHLSPGFASKLSPWVDAEPHGTYLKMAISDLEATKSISERYATGASRLTPDDLPALQLFYQEAYPGNWFDPRMLETMQFFGVWDPTSQRTICAVAGIHVFSPLYRVAALGNIATHPLYRRKGYARCATSALVLSLMEIGIVTIGLNVKADNHGAIEMYRELGFLEIGMYEECMFRKKSE